MCEIHFPPNFPFNLLYTPPTLFTHLLHHSQLPWHQSHIHSHFNLKTLHLPDCIYKTQTLFLAFFSSWWSSNWAKRRNYLPFPSHQSCHCLINSPPDQLLSASFFASSANELDVLTAIDLRRAFTSASANRSSIFSASVAAGLFPNLSCSDS